MVTCCCVDGCKREAYPGSGFSFHKIPRDEVRRQKWLNVVPGNISKHSMICSAHFLPDDFNCLIGKRTLKRDAIPSLFGSNPKTFDFFAYMRTQESISKDKQTANTVLCTSKGSNNVSIQSEDEDGPDNDLMDVNIGPAQSSDDEYDDSPDVTYGRGGLIKLCKPSERKRTLMQTTFTDCQKTKHPSKVSKTAPYASLSLPVVVCAGTEENGKYLLEINGNLTPNKLKGEISFSTTSKKLEASMDFHNYSGVPLTRLCRLCASPRIPDEKIYSVQNKNIIDMMRKCLNLTFNRDTRLSDFICVNCHNQLEKSFNFYKRSREADTLLNNKLFSSLSTDGLPMAYEEVWDGKKDNTSPQDMIVNLTGRCSDTSDHTDKVVLNIEINRMNNFLHCPFCEYVSIYKTIMGTHLVQFHLHPHKNDKDVYDIQACKEFKTNINASYHNVSKNIPKIASSVVKSVVDNSESITFNDATPNLNTSVSVKVCETDTNIDVHLCNKSTIELIEVIPDPVYEIDYVDNEQEDKEDDIVPLEYSSEEPSQNYDVKIKTIVTVDPALFTDYIVNESVNGAIRCIKPSCMSVFKDVVMRSLHSCTYHAPYNFVYRCDTCTQAFANIPQIQDHLLQKHETVMDPEEVVATRVKLLFSCDACSALFVRYIEAKEHQKNCENYNRKELVCFCGEIMPSVIVLLDHFNKHKLDGLLLRRPVCKVFYICGICEMIFSAIGKSQKHLKQDHTPANKKVPKRKVRRRKMLPNFVNKRYISKALEIKEN